MMSERAAALIAAFTAARMKGQESEEKLELVRELEDFPEPEVTEFFTQVATDPGEYDLARVEALKILELRRFDDDVLRASVARALLAELSDDDDDMVRSYAARSLANFTGVPGVLPAVATIVLNQDEDTDVRHNAFFALERGGPSPEALELMTKCLGDAEFRAGAQRVLSRWQTA